jgi:hypothetical protein
LNEKKANNIAATASAAAAIKKLEDQNQDIENENNDLTSATSSTTTLTATVSVSQVNIQKPTLLCRIRQPTNLNKLETVNTSNLYQILKNNESVTPSDIAGVGVNHLMSKLNAELKAQVAEKTYNVRFNDDNFNQISGSSNINENTTKIDFFDVDFKFLPSNRFISSSSDHSDLHNNMSVRWKKTNQLLFYSLARITKDLESKYENCISMVSQIKLVEFSTCYTLLALTLESNTLVVFDLNTGLMKHCVQLKNIKKIIKISFKSEWGSSKNESKIICLTDNGFLYQIDCSLETSSCLNLIYEPKYSNFDDKSIDIKTCKYFPSLLLIVSETKKFYFFDIELGSLICELDNQENEKDDLNSIQFGFGLGNKQLFIKFKSNKTSQCKLLCHSLNLIIKLEAYFKDINSTNENYSIQNVFEDKMDQLLRKR